MTLIMLHCTLPRWVNASQMRDTILLQYLFKTFRVTVLTYSLLVCNNIGLSLMLSGRCFDNIDFIELIVYRILTHSLLKTTLWRSISHLYRKVKAFT